jgi:hypothetical protein
VGADPQALEDRLSVIESKANRAIIKIRQERMMPADPELWSALMVFMGLMATRTPATRDWLEKFRQEMIRRMAYAIFPSRDSYESSERRLREKDPNHKSIPYEEIRAFAQSDRYDIIIKKDDLMATAIDMGCKIATILALRQWEVVSLPDDDIVCSDDPLSLHWIPGEEVTGFGGNPGFGVPGTEVTFPLDSKTLLIGRFWKKVEPYRLDRIEIGRYNYFTTMHADYIYAKNGQFPVFVDFKHLVTGYQVAEQSKKRSQSRRLADSILT